MTNRPTDAFTDKYNSEMNKATQAWFLQFNVVSSREVLFCHNAMLWLHERLGNSRVFLSKSWNFKNVISYTTYLKLEQIIVDIHNYKL